MYLLSHSGATIQSVDLLCERGHYLRVKHVSIVGVLNATPDSYVPESRTESVEKAVQLAGQMLADGADIIEIGGESTGPGSEDVSLKEELQRTIEVVRAITEAYPHAALSIDTYKAEVAKQAIETGVSMVNDVTAGRADPTMFSVLANSSARLVLMYAKDDSPRTTVETVEYDSVMSVIKTFLSERLELAEKAGIPRERLCIDPGLGHFISSEPRYSYEILGCLNLLESLGVPIFLSPSRKSFLAGEEKLQTADRLPGTIAASSIAVLHGARYIRTHDVLAVRRGCEVAEAVLHAEHA